MIEKELGKHMSNIFASFVLDPLATASDLKNAKSSVEWIAWAEPQYDFNPMIDE
ncbi:hypothetical protein PVAP13_2KG239616 [Panicum virgatum]|uniref:Uncharacterized protein n=1 Tax=Panicum virgatum TaxID=38727 RepID=A0A8T0WAF7_PANVG|nr:hypothetical protein PVAP13_2KG239616 [Panicum virgatum]